ncbi:MAG TPA: CbiX/SirB N-terminal domain-containing protein [Verrucomicrobiae bacterium]|nr:CbiX/SirB N-terminal domain-containing protein [Verrucomicrobiae bacterium]
MSQTEFADTALVLLGHGTTRDENSSAPVFQHAAALRDRRLFAEVHEAFWKQPPQIQEVLASPRTRRVLIVPLFMSEGYFSEEAIPRALGFATEGPAESARVRHRDNQILVYCRPVGTHPALTRVVAARAAEVIQQAPFPRAPATADTTLFAAGHGTEQSENSRLAIDRHVEILRQERAYAAVHAVFLDEEPRIAACFQLAQTRNIVMVPCFVSDGLHVRQDIPVLLGEPARLVQQRLQAGQPTWRNPTEKQGKLVWLSRSVGSESGLAELILERASEGAAWVKCP